MRQKIEKKLRFLRLFKLEQNPRGILETSLFNFFKKKGKIIFVFLIFLIVKFFDFLGGFF